MMKSHIVYLILGVSIIFLAFHIYSAGVVLSDLKGKFNVVEKSFADVKQENEKINEEIDYLSDEHNLEKELRARTNYHYPNEKMIIIAPSQNN